MKESILYGSVKRFLEDKYGCFYSCIEAGKQGFGSVDVFGVRYKDQRTQIETIGVEVKVNKSNICASFGQAKGYSLLCDKVYFASYQDGFEKNAFSEKDIKAAKHLSIGIIKIYGIEPNFVCEEVLEAPRGKPVKNLLLEVLRYKAIFQCNTCRVFSHYDRKTFTTTNNSKFPYYDWTKQQIRDGKSLSIKSIDDEDSHEFYCNFCAKSKLGIH